MKDYNCFFCKYRKDPEGCQEQVFNANWRCPSISNIWYGKMIKHFPFNLIFKIQLWFLIRKADKEFKERGIN